MNSKESVIRLLKYIVPYKKYILCSTIGGVIKLTIPLIIPQIIRYFTDDLLLPNNLIPANKKINIILTCLIFLIILYIIVYIPATYLREYGALFVSNQVMHQLRCEVYDHLLLMSAKFHSKYKSGELVGGINSDIEQIQGFVWSVATNVWIDSIILIVYVALMLPISPILTIMACITLPISTIVTKKVRILIKENGRKRQASLSKISGYFQERMAGFAAVRLFHAEKYEKEKFSTLSYRITKFTEKQDKLSSVGAAVSAVFYMLIQAVILCTAAIMVVKNRMTIGNMLVFYSYVGWMLTPLQRFSELNVTYARSMAGIERIFKLLDTLPDLFENKKGVNCFLDEKYNLSFRHVSFSYDKNNKLILDDINFEIKEGEKVAIVGRSGSGKTTLVNLIARLYDPDKGEILWGNCNLKNYTYGFFYKNIGMVLQDTILFSESIIDNLRYAKQEATMEEIEKAAKLANAYEFIINTPKQWETKLGEGGWGLSGGQKQRLAITRVFLRNPKILILDEATSSLDSESEELVQSALDRLMEGRTSIVVAHRLSTIINSDKIIVMDQGKIVETGTHQELLSRNGYYAKLYYKQFREISC